MSSILLFWKTGTRSTFCSRRLIIDESPLNFRSVAIPDERYPSSSNSSRSIHNATPRRPPQHPPPEPTTQPPQHKKESEARPMSTRERIQQFPRGVNELYKDCLLYKNIHDASRTPMNAWTVNHPFLRRRSGAPGADATPWTNLISSTAQSKTKRPFFMVYQNERRPGRIPRRQHEQQRRLQADLSMVLPLVIMWLPPIIGYLPMILAVAAPRQVLSRQFLNEYEVHHFSELEFQQRKHFVATVAEQFWNATTFDGEPLTFPVLGCDAAGPIIDPSPLFDDRGTSDSSSNPYRQFLSSVRGLPREYLVPLALALGVHQHLPLPLARFVTQWCAPQRWLRFQVQRVARVVADDDALLLEEGAVTNRSENLTDLEVLDACLMRGLPILNDTDEMRECLTNHLIMMASVKERLRPTHMSDESFRLMSVHLPILRASLR